MEEEKSLMINMDEEERKNANEEEKIQQPNRKREEKNIQKLDSNDTYESAVQRAMLSSEDEKKSENTGTVITKKKNKAGKGKGRMK